LGNAQSSLTIGYLGLDILNLHLEMEEHERCEMNKTSGNDLSARA
jgi:hypothetical protein